MAVNKVVYNAKVLLDLTGDTVTPETLAKGVTAHDKSGEKITGTAPTASEILGDTGFLSLTWVDVTIGANTVSLGDAAIKYLDELAGWRMCAAALLENPTTQNQLIMVPGAMTHPNYIDSTNQMHPYTKFGYRYRDGACQPQSLNSSYAFVLKEGTKYRLWINNLNTTNLKPY